MLSHRAKFLIQFNHKNVIDIDNVSDTDSDKQLDKSKLSLVGGEAEIDFSKKVAVATKKAKSPFEKALEKEKKNV